MNAAQEAFLFKNEANYGVWITPTMALPISSCNLTSKRGLLIPSLTGFGRGRGVVVQGEKPVSGQLVLPLWPQYMPSILRALFTAVVSTQQGGTIAYRHKLLLDDTAAFGSLSVEKQYSSAMAQFVKGVQIGKLTIGCKAKEIAVCTLDLVAKDDAWVGGTWDDTGAAAPVITSPVPYPATLVLPFRFYQGVVYKGGTVALTSGELVVAAGAALGYVEAAEIAIDTGLDPFYGLSSTPTQIVAREGEHKITCKLDVDWIGHDDDFIVDGRTAAETIVQLKFVGGTIAGGYAYECTLTLPRCVPPQAEPPALAGDKKRRSGVVNYECLKEATTDHDVGLVFQNASTSI
jgi:hypothetical protein